MTIPQNANNAIDARVTDAPSSCVMSSCAQLPFIVSQTPYMTANPAKSQNRDGIRRRCRAAAAAPVRSGSRTLTARSPTRNTPASTGKPHQKPSPTKIATNTGASAVPRPSSAFNTRTARSSPSGWNAAANVFSAGTVSPKPAPRNPVATSSSGYATAVLSANPQLTTRSVIETTSAASPAR